MNANEIIIDNDFCGWNGIRTIFFQCQHIKHRWGEIFRCGGDSMILATFLTASGTQITKHLCETHFNDIIKQAQEKGFKIIDMRGE